MSHGVCTLIECGPPLFRKFVVGRGSFYLVSAVIKSMVRSFCPYLVHVTVTEAPSMWDKTAVRVKILVCEFQEESQVHGMHCGEPLSSCPSFQC